MKLKPIIAEPMALDAAGVITTRQAAIFIHIGRCGLLGTTIPQIFEGLRMPGSTVTNIVNQLLELSLVTPAGRANSRGRTKNYVVTVKGWNVLTQPADFSMFSHSQQSLESHACKKSRKNTPAEDETTTANSAGIDMDGGGDNNHCEDSGDRATTERETEALEGETPGDEGREGTSKTHDAEPVTRS